MLESLHVKNLALIDEQEIEFSRGLNILTGETGAGKSILIGSINLALGAKADKEYIRTGADYALVELLFSLNPRQCQRLKELELPLEEDGTLLLQRKITAGRSLCRVNGESVSAGQLRELAGCLLDMYGQHEHQSLCKPSEHKRLLDEYAGIRVAELKEQLKEKLYDYRKTKEELDKKELDEEARQRELQLLAFEVNEIDSAGLIPQEDEQAEKRYNRLIHARKIKETACIVHILTGYEGENGAGNAVGHALRELKGASAYDEELMPLIRQLTDIDDLLNDFNRSMADYQESLEFDQEEFSQLEERLNVLNHLKSKYGGSIEEILKSRDRKQQELETLENYQAYRQQLQIRLAAQKEEILELCGQISKLRSQAAVPLAEKLKTAMIDLNFLDVEFIIAVTPKEEEFGAEGYDQVEFLISTNPGEALKPLWQIASGGELSRIMLAFKSVFADKDETDTLVFDEIDAGISGKTAWKVAAKLGKLSVDHQIICITHLAQIASMSDEHFLIEKSMKQDRTVTDIRHLDEEESLKELARILGSGELTEAALSNAREMKAAAREQKL